jgi:TonB-linked SusC/RagA family outer membrane protein
MKSKNGIKKAVSYLMLCLFFVAISASAYAQQKTVTGKVVDKGGEPLPGVTVVLKGTTQGTVTNIDGVYSIPGVTRESVLVISFVGMLTQEVVVGTKSSINVSLEASTIDVDEVVIVGYGTQKKATLTGAVSQVKGEDMLKGKGTSNATLALQGEVPGLVVTRTSSRPGNEGLSIKIRGDISVNNIGPLILLDGLEIPEWQLSAINANDIETYSVLKDGAAAIYGTKAAGGVILITTKKGNQGALKVSYKGDYQMNFADDFPLADLKDWARMYLQGGDNTIISYQDANGVSQKAAANYRFFTRDELLKVIDGTLPMAPDSYYFNGKVQRLADVNQYDATYGTTPSHRHDLSFSGGNEKATYRTSLGYSDERSPIDYVYDGAKKYNFRTNVSYKINDLLKTEFIVTYDNRLVDEPTQGVGEGVQDPYFLPLFNPAGQYYDVFGFNNILAKLDQGGRTKNREQIFRLGGKVTLDLSKYVKGLSFNYNGNISSRVGNKTTRTTSNTLYDWDGNVSGTPTSLLTSSVRVAQNFVTFQNHVVQANYLHSFGQHNLGLMTGATAEQTQNNTYGEFRSNMKSDDLNDLNTGDVLTQTNSGGSSAVGLISYIGKLNYDYKGIFLFEALGRRDGSSRLHPDYRWKNFYSGSAGIRLSELPTIKNLGVFDNLKFRTSYGETGSVTGIGEYDYISSMNAGSAVLGTTPAYVNTAWIAAMTSTDRTWERVANTNFALDFSVLKNRLSGTAEYYIRENTDMLIPITYPQVIGATAPYTNSGDFTTNGWEISLNWKDKIGELKYNVGVMVWDSRSEVARMAGKTAIVVGRNAIVEGKPLNALYTYKTDGYFQTEAEVLAYYNQYGFTDPTNQNVMKPGTLLPKYRSPERLIPGCVKRVDVDGPNKDGVPDGIISTADLVYQGDGNPHNSYGINLSLDWKGFDFSAFFQGVGQQNIIRTGALAYPFATWFRNFNPTFLGQTWTPDNPNAPNPIMTYTTTNSLTSWNYSQTNDINIVHSAYCRAKVLTLGYTFPKQILNKSGIDKVRLSVTGNDLFVISNAKDGMDPEMGISANQGNSVPYMKTLLFGLEITF